MVTRARARGPAGVLLAACALLFGPGSAAGADPANLLQPGSRPAVGLGGDPFLSPLADDSGWWGSFRFHSSTGVQIDALSDEPVTESGAKHKGHADDRRLGWTLDGAARAGPARLSLGARLEARSADLSWRGSQSTVESGAHGSGLTVAARATGLAPGLTLQAIAPAGWPGCERTTSSAGAGARFELGGFIRVQGQFSRARVPEVLQVLARDQPVDAPMNLSADVYRADLRVRLASRLEAEASAGATWLRPIQPRDTAWTFEHFPRGHVYDQQASLAWGRPGRRVLGRWSRVDLDASEESTWGGLRFAQIPTLHGGLGAWLAAAEWTGADSRRWLMEAEQFDLRGRAFGAVETWPFTSLLVGLLGTRGYASATAHADGWRAHVGHDRPVGGALRVQMAATWYDIRPEASLLTWESAVGGLGARDLRRYRLSVSRVQLAAISTSLSGTAKRLQWSVNLRQFVYARSVHAGGSANGGGGGVASPSSPPARGWPGGTRLEACVRRALRAPVTK